MKAVLLRTRAQDGSGSRPRLHANCPRRRRSRRVAGRGREGEAEPHGLRAAPPQARGRAARVAARPLAARRRARGRAALHRPRARRLGSGLEPLRRGFKAPLGAASRGRARAPRGRRALRHAAHRLRLPARAALPTGAAQPPAGVGARRDAARAHPRAQRRDGTAGDRADPGVLGRVGCWVSAAVTERTTVALLRLRHQLVTQRPGRGATTLLVEEATALAWSGAAGARSSRAPTRSRFSRPPPAGDPPPHVRERAVAQALELADASSRGPRRLRRAPRPGAARRPPPRPRGRRGPRQLQRQGAPCRLDVIGLFVLLPQGGLTHGSQSKTRIERRASREPARSSPSRRSPSKAACSRPSGWPASPQLAAGSQSEADYRVPKGLQPPRRDRPLLAHRPGALERLRGRRSGGTGPSRAGARRAVRPRACCARASASPPSPRPSRR